MSEEKQVVKYTTLNKRMMAISIDMLLVTLVLNPVMALLEKFVYMGRTPYMALVEYAQNADVKSDTIDITGVVNLFIGEGLLGKFLFMQLIPFIILGIYFIYCWSKYGRTFGGYLLSIAVKTDAEVPEMISKKRAFFRFLASFLCYLTLGIGYLILSFNKKRQAIHDRICRTIVVEEKPDFSLVEKLGFRVLNK